MSYFTLVYCLLSFSTTVYCLNYDLPYFPSNLDENLSFYILIKIPKNVLKPYGERNNKWPFRREIEEIVVETVDSS